MERRADPVSYTHLDVYKRQQESSLFQMIKKTTQENPNKIISAYKDNVNTEREEGRAEGIEEGINKGERKKAIEVARYLKSSGTSIKLIMCCGRYSHASGNYD